jgi:AcrR family transcriptional regulator
MIVEATLPLVLANGEMLTTRQIAEAAGIAEGTIFRAFADKDALISAVVEAALDIEPLERALATIDPSLPLDELVTAAALILQQRVIDIWRLMSSIGARFHDRTTRRPEHSDVLIALFAAHRPELRVDPETAAQLLRALTLSTTHPMIADTPMLPGDIATLFLHGVSADHGAAPC